MKEDVPGLSFITRLRPVTYQLNREKINDFNGVNERRRKLKEENPGAEFQEGDKYSPVTTGFIAQEVEEAAKKIGYNFSGVDVPKNDNDFYGLRYAEFVVPLVKAVQELKAENDMIKTLNDALKSENDAIKARLDVLEALIKKQ